ncbi:MAG: hypothetical protein QM731_29190 [Chitinophagaceae bacterium]
MMQDAEQRRVTVTVSDPWSVEEIVVAGDRQIAKGIWRYGAVYDLRGSTWVPSEPDLLWLVTRGHQQVALHGARGPVAIVVDATASSQLVQCYVEYGGGADAARVFESDVAAADWLASQPVSG